MNEADFDPESFSSQGQAKADENLLVKFYTKPRKDNAKSLEAGRAIFVETEYVDIRVPGSSDSVARPATYADKQRFPRHYAAYKARVELPVEGTPLAEWTMVSRSMAEELSHKGIKTVEQLANLNDNLAGQMMGMHGFKQKAQNWLDQAKAEVTTSHLQEELAERDTTIEAMQAQINELMEAVARMPTVVSEEED